MMIVVDARINDSDPDPFSVDTSLVKLVDSGGPVDRPVRRSGLLAGRLLRKDRREVIAIHGPSPRDLLHLIEGVDVVVIAFHTEAAEDIAIEFSGNLGPNSFDLACEIADGNALIKVSTPAAGHLDVSAIDLLAGLQ